MVQPSPAGWDEPPASAGSWANVSGAHLRQGGGCIPAEAAVHPAQELTAVLLRARAQHRPLVLLSTAMIVLSAAFLSVLAEP